MWAIQDSQWNAYGGPTREQYCCTHILPCKHKLKHEEHRKDRNQNSPSSTSYYEAVIPVHTVARWHGHEQCLGDARVTMAALRVPAVTRTQAQG